MRPRLSPPPRPAPSASRTTLAIWAADPARGITGPWRIEKQNYAENYEPFDLEIHRGTGAGHGRHGSRGHLQLRRGRLRHPRRQSGRSVEPDHYQRLEFFVLGHQRGHKCVGWLQWGFVCLLELRREVGAVVRPDRTKRQ